MFRACVWGMIIRANERPGCTFKWIEGETFVPPLLARLAFVLLAIPAIAGPPERGPMPHLVDLYGDPLPEGAVVRLGSVRLRHAGLKDFTLLADGKTAVTVGTDQMVRWWDLESGKQTWANRLPEKLSFEKLALSRDGELLAAMCEDSFVVLKTRSNVIVRKTPTEVIGVELLKFSPDGESLVVANDSITLTLISIQTGSTQKVNISQIADWRGMSLRVVFSADSRRMLVSRSWEVPWRRKKLGLPLIKTEEIGQISSFEHPAGKASFALRANSVADALSPDGERFALCSMKAEDSKEFKVQLVEIKTGHKTMANIEVVDAEGLRIEFTPEGRTLVCMERARTTFVDIATNKVLCRIDKGMQGRLSLDGKHIAAIGHQRLDVWDCTTGKKLHEDGVGAFSSAPAVSRDNRTLVFDDVINDRIGFWNVSNGRFLRSLEMPDYHMGLDLRFSEDGQTLIACREPGEIRTWSKRTNQWSRPIRLSNYSTHGGWEYGHSLSPDGRYFAQVVRNGAPGPDRVNILDASTGHVICRKGLSPLSRPALNAWYPDGSAVAIDTDAEGLTIADSSTGKTGMRIPSHGYSKISADSRLLLSGFDPAKVWDLTSGKELLSIQVGEAGYPHVAVASSYRAIVVTEGRVIRVIELATGNERGRFFLPDFGHGVQVQTPVQATYVLPGDRQVLTTMIDGTALIWDLTAFPPPKLADKHDDVLRTTWWNDLAGGDAKVAYASGWKLSEGPPEDVVRFLNERMKPARDPDANAVKQLIADLNSGEFRTREAASKRLIELGPGVLPYLRAASKKPDSAEAGRRIEALIEKLSDPVPPPASLQAIRAFAVLERLGTTEARKLLEELARGAAGSPETKSANSALVRMRALAGGW